MSDKCSGYRQGEIVCEHGHPQSFACWNPKESKEVPVCVLDEPGEMYWVCFYDKDTGYTRKYVSESGVK